MSRRSEEIASLDTLRERWLTAAREGPPRFPACAGCQAWSWPPTVVCPVCGEGRWRLVSVPGTGLVRAATTVHRGVAPEFADEAPYRVGAVALDDGPLFLTRLDVGVHQGSRVRLRWRDRPGDGWLWASAGA
ncbi:hypothetical protein ER308_13135 [Egibacter rhizosphaerae]|uniref:ChsH2 C-terminal OB-fold domain-containing protein n=1 Tax=Egibacter rhizosphaerae TaxID=1670831 RepID=A0A411YGV5_9ACTN|nr:OB-fold domain-containing protein [Egibacter rhizosphaerae]QBI20417.1 hypothetical protein ER308_13135 [Egibacter rhizosphaerae]